MTILEVRRTKSRDMTQPSALYIADVHEGESELDQIAKTVPEDTNARLLDTLSGVGPYTALFLAPEIGDANRFSDSKHACAYLGLVP